jgi:hypothetical protein
MISFDNSQELKMGGPNYDETSLDATVAKAKALTEAQLIAAMDWISTIKMSITRITPGTCGHNSSYGLELRTDCVQ